ncbi:MAG TPA: GMC family oxidoreductase, partial [Terriglobales bacterium]|nr:GMC family oxidoreductase [Terriglobales bacterium]
LLESGGLQLSPPAQELNQGTIVGDPYASPKLTRHRQAGGTVHLWNTRVGDAEGAKYVPLDEIDFEARAWTEMSGWPFERRHLEPFYCRAQRLCGLGVFDYDGHSWTDAEHPPLPLTGDRLTTRIYQFGAGQIFTKTYLDELRQASNISLCYHANVTGLETDASGQRVASARVACLRGRAFVVRAKAFVLAGGAIENARLLLLSNQRHPQGLGNQHGWVGRCFMEHPRDYSLTLMPKDGRLLEEAAFYAPHAASGVLVMGRLALRQETMCRAALPNMSVTLLPQPNEPWLISALGLDRLWGRRRSFPSSQPGWSLAKRKARNFGGFRLLINLEQIPNQENRIVLGRKRDALGQPKVEIHWRWRPLDEENLERLRALVTDELEQSGLGRIECEPGLRPDPNAHHHAGTTRMNPDPRYGVADENARVHGIENLFLAGGSLFPTAGFANPTLTIAALTLRLADHLKRGAI